LGCCFAVFSASILHESAQNGFLPVCFPVIPVVSVLQGYYESSVLSGKPPCGLWANNIPISPAKETGHFKHSAFQRCLLYPILFG
jgi:hypothetical protein